MLTITDRLRTGEEAMMRKIMTLLVLAGLSLGLSSAVLANDGSLHIDTSLNQGGEKKDISYIEQEGELSALFQSETDLSIKKKQQHRKETSQTTKNHLFMTRIDSDSLVARYQPLLFNPEQRMAATDDRYGVLLAQKSAGITWQMLAILLVGAVLTGYSLTRGRLSRQKHKRHHE